MTDVTSTGPGSAMDTSTSVWPRTGRRPALRPASSRRELDANAREEARLVRGRDAFVWQRRMLPIAVPFAAGAGLFVWRRRRSTRDAITVALAVGALSYLEACVEWTARRNAYRRRRDRD